MKYINTRTQAVIDTACVVSGGDWVPMEEGKADAATTAVPQKAGTVKKASKTATETKKGSGK